MARGSASAKHGRRRQIRAATLSALTAKQVMRGVIGDYTWTRRIVVGRRRGGEVRG
jgi:hypothetical protein